MNNTIERICKIYGYLAVQEQSGADFISSKELAEAIGTTEYTVRKDFSVLDIKGYTRKGYEVKSLKEKLGVKFRLNKERRACIVGLGRLGTALLDYEHFQNDGFEIIAGFDSSINKIERIQTKIDVFPVGALAEVVSSRGIELGIITVPAKAAQEIADVLIRAGVKGILNFSPVKLNVPKDIVRLDMDFTNALRFIAAKFVIQNK
ncbi:MAG: redox-sensing transcriptional repressor Rex [Candidatus Omnitrophica bacterium]|nr:redox-sensing transcriptional repressor Rex [Candidatus Omnitrophota bacterium]MBU4479731.1 redox-sensing transcriptional repressor Rex [Candidatus Omnitrophota bacterium]